MHSIRQAVPEDARVLAALAETTFRDTFAAQNTPEDMDLHCRQSYGEALQRAELLDPARLTLLCELEGRAIAFAQLRWGSAPACVEAARAGEIQRLYVDRPWHGRGVAQDLMAASLEALGGRGSDLAWLGVWERNPRALAFYAKWGFTLVGDHTFPLGTDPQRDLIMVKALGGPG